MAATAGVGASTMCKGVAAGDYDNDLDLYLSNIGPNVCVVVTEGRAEFERKTLEAFSF